MINVISGALPSRMTRIEEKIRAIENGLRVGSRVSRRLLDRRMIDYRVPGVSIAVVENGMSSDR